MQNINEKIHAFNALDKNLLVKINVLSASEMLIPTNVHNLVAGITTLKTCFQCGRHS